MLDARPLAAAALTAALAPTILAAALAPTALAAALAAAALHGRRYSTCKFGLFYLPADACLPF